MITNIRVVWNPDRFSTNTFKNWGHDHTQDGPWAVEPDYVEGQIFSTRIFIHRSPVTGALNGYVALPAEHPWHGKPYDFFEDVCVHGGVTYSGSAEDVGLYNGDGLWAIGFDCAHAGDLCPAFFQINGRWSGHYWDLNEVLCETIRLAVQVANSHVTDPEFFVQMQEVEHKCRVKGPKGLYEWIWEEPIRARALEEREKCC